MIQSQVGKFISVGESEFIQTEKLEVGYAVYGPYITLPKGDYCVQFEVQPARRMFGNPFCCQVDVVANAGRITLAKKRLRVSELLKSDGKAEINFSLPEELTCEFRVYSFGIIPLSVRYDRPVKAIIGAQTDLTPMLKPGETTSNQFFLINLAKFRLLHHYGVSFSVSADSVIGTYGGVTFEIGSAEEFQIIEEVILGCDYNILSDRRAIAIDIGMNVGFTSLFLANQASVAEVHSFEPFVAPYRQAVRNFALNPLHAAKITPHNFGVSDKQEFITILSRADRTIGTSIRGAASGAPETIEIRDAADIFRELAIKAKSQDMDLIVKIDCEGSEYAIFESLETNQLLDTVDVFMIEWHKWWSASKTQMDLVAPLVKAGFVVIDRTNHMNPHAAMLYAVRRGTVPRAG